MRNDKELRVESMRRSIYNLSRAAKPSLIFLTLICRDNPKMGDFINSLILRYRITQKWAVLLIFLSRVRAKKILFQILW